MHGDRRIAVLRDGHIDDRTVVLLGVDEGLPDDLAGLLRGQLRLLNGDSELNWSASDALGDGADVYVMTW